MFAECQYESFLGVFGLMRIENTYVHSGGGGRTDNFSSTRPRRLSCLGFINRNLPPLIPGNKKKRFTHNNQQSTRITITKNSYAIRYFSDGGDDIGGIIIILVTAAARVRCIIYVYTHMFYYRIRVIRTNVSRWQSISFRLHSMHVRLFFGAGRRRRYYIVTVLNGLRQGGGGTLT